jgi:hypothetical protein
VKKPSVIEDIPSLGKKGTRGAGEKAAISLAREEGVETILMDDNTARREAKKRGLKPLWLLEVLEGGCDGPGAGYTQQRSDEHCNLVASTPGKGG